ncbi:MAG TPA: hypothetical protein VMT27_03085 [Actinomycetes bacterium]|nr:hypothetical protein [Actinomycetes bacterium]
MPLNDTLLNIGANAMAAAATYLALHTANPEPSGTNPATSARVAAAWPGAATGDLTITNKAFTGGTFYGSVALTGDTTFNSAGEYTITSLTVNGSST